jgi:hypothetical protein
MSRCLTVVAFALVVLTGAIGLRNLALTHSANLSSPVLMASGLPMPPTGGGHVSGLPMPPTGGGHVSGLPMPPTGGGH